MVRKAIPKATQTKVLTRSGRRCCLCTGLNGDWAVKKGQIAHLDGDATNNKLENLAWLCQPHHDEYDSKTSQTKGITIGEVKQYRDELYQVRAESSDIARKKQFVINAAKGAKPRKRAKGKKPPNFAELLRHADSLVSIASRETEYYRVVTLAVAFGKTSTALEAAERLASLVNRERAFWMIFSHLLQKRDKKGAERIIPMLASIVNRERARTMLLRA